MLSFHIAPGFIGSLHLATCGIQASIPCHNGSRIRIFLPLPMPWNRPIPAGDTSWTASLLRPLPQRQRIPHFPAVADALEPAYPRGRHLLDCFAPTPLATTAAESAFSCRCGCPGTGLSPRETPLGLLRSYAPRHNGSESRIFLPLRMPTAA